MSNLNDVDLETGYASGPQDLLSGFYRPCLKKAMNYDRAVGFFRSSLFAVAGVAFSDFAKRRGRMRLVCSPRLTHEDFMALREGVEVRTRVGSRLKEDLKQITESPVNVPVVEFLATLVGAGILDVRLAFKSNDLGIYHNKVGIFTDTAGNSVSFLGTTNETLSAWCSERNHEGLEVFRSWVESDSSRVVRHERYFEDLWSQNIDGLQVFELRDVAEEALREYQVEGGVDEAAERVRSQLNTGGSDTVDGMSVDPAFELMEHQSETVRAWFRNGNQGIVKHATGAGKTITALEIVRRWMEEDFRPAVIIVPTTILVEQWIEEAVCYLGSSVAVLQVGGGRAGRNWEEALGAFTMPGAEFGRRLTVSTLATARTKRFRRKCVGGDHLLVVGDEVHTIGSKHNREVAKVDAGGTLGLSATPRRYGDPEGTDVLYQYFGSILKPVVTLEDAISSGRLVPYDYYPHPVALTEKEQKRWDDLTRRIARQFASLPEDHSGNKVQTDRFKHLLIQRAAILKQAEGKVELAVEILTAEYQNGERWIVYCDNTDQLGAVTDALRECDLPVMEYHSVMEGSREATMEYFRDRAGVMTAIKCLDEGVDIPEAGSALILASSSNPREFIQRRGRVLRSSPGKFSATIHDALVVPADDEKGDRRVPILRTELSRAAEFAGSARNSGARFRIRSFARDLGLSVDEIVREAYEEDVISE